MRKRYIGDAVITLHYVGISSDGRAKYRGEINANGKIWPFDNLCSGVGGYREGNESPEAFDRAAASAASFGSYYTSHNRGDDTPDWAPTAEIADEIESAIMGGYSDNPSGGYMVRRTPNGPERHAD